MGRKGAGEGVGEGLGVGEEGLTGRVTGTSAREEAGGVRVRGQKAN